MKWNELEMHSSIIMCTCKSFVRRSFYDSPASPAALTFHKILHALQIERFSGNSYRRCLVHFCLFSMISFDDVFVLLCSIKDTKIKQVSYEYYGVLFLGKISPMVGNYVYACHARWQAKI